MQKHWWHRKCGVHKDSQQKFLVKHIHPFKIINIALIRNLIYALWLCLARQSFYLTFPVLLSQNFLWVWTCFAESVRMCDNHGGHLHGWPPEKKAKNPFLALLCAEPWVASSASASGSGWGSRLGRRYRCTRVTATSTPAWGEAAQRHALSKHLPASHPELPSSLSGFYLLFPRRCPLLELHMIVWYIEPNISPG